jgi:hypothetical protein
MGVSASAKRDYLQLGFSVQQNLAGSETGGFDLKALRNNTPVYLANYGGAVGSATWRFYTEGTERLSINSAGDVNIGGAADAGNTLRFFDIYNTNSGANAGSIVRLITSNAAASGNTTVDIVKYKNGTFSINNNETNAAACTTFNVGASERMRITSTGNLLVGNTSSKAAITVEKDGVQLFLGPKTFGAGVEGGEINFGRGTDGSTGWTMDVLAGATPNIRLISGSAVGVELVNGATAWSAYSDTRLKKNITPLRSVLNDIQQIECINYHLLNADTEDTPIRVGVSAQSLVGKFDEVVDAVQLKGDTTDYLAVRYSDMVPYLIKAIQELKAEFDAYKSTHP